MAKKQQVYVNRKHKKTSAVVPALVIVVLSLVIAFTGAYAWQAMSGDEAKLQAKSSMSSLLEDLAGSKSESTAPSSVPESSGEAASDSQVDQSYASTAEAVSTAGAVPKGTRADSSYFDDAMFVGDSITNGILSYQIMENATVISYTGINPDTISTKEVFRGADGNLITILDAMKQNADKKKIYILLGSNGIAWLEQKHFIESYEAFLQEVVAQHPDAVVYVQAIPPINEKKFPEHYSGDVTNAKINAYNADIAAMAQRSGVYYLDITEAFKDSSGQLADEATTDGMHFTATYYQKWFDYLKTHTVQP